jgi:hypothetical protein
MTQLIAAICDGGQTVVTVSDRMISTGDMTLTFEPDRSKAIPIAYNAVLLTSGTMHEPDLIDDARQLIRGKDRIRDIADVLKEQYQTLRERRIEDELLRPLAGIRSFAEYHQKQSSLHEGVLMEMNARIAEFSLGLTLLLAGYDGQGHVIVIEDPGIWTSWDMVAHAYAGMGNRHVEGVFAWYRYTQAFRLNEALWVAFEAKKRSEAAGGVGKMTDALVINRDGISQLAGTTIAELDSIYDAREDGGRRNFDKRVSELSIQREPVADS